MGLSRAILFCFVLKPFLNHDVIPLILNRAIFKPKTKNELANAIKMYIEDNESAAKKYPPIKYWDTSLITDMSELFKDFNEDISNWNVSSAADMKHMFIGASSFNQDIGRWDVGSTADMNFMFEKAKSFNKDSTYWNVQSKLCV